MLTCCVFLPSAKAPYKCYGAYMEFTDIETYWNVGWVLTHSDKLIHGLRACACKHQSSCDGIFLQRRTKHFDTGFSDMQFSSRWNVFSYEEVVLGYFDSSGDSSLVHFDSFISCKFMGRFVKMHRRRPLLEIPLDSKEFPGNQTLTSNLQERSKGWPVAGETFTQTAVHTINISEPIPLIH